MPPTVAAPVARCSRRFLLHNTRDLYGTRSTVYGHGGQSRPVVKVSILSLHRATANQALTGCSNACTFPYSTLVHEWIHYTYPHYFLSPTHDYIYSPLLSSYPPPPPPPPSLYPLSILLLSVSLSLSFIVIIIITLG